MFSTTKQFDVNHLSVIQIQFKTSDDSKSKTLQLFFETLKQHSTTFCFDARPCLCNKFSFIMSRTGPADTLMRISTEDHPQTKRYVKLPTLLVFLIFNI